MRVSLNLVNKYINLLDILTTTEELKKIAKSQNTYSKYEEEIEFLCFTHVIYKILRTVMMENDEERIEVYTKLREYLKKNHKYKETKYYRTKMYYKIALVTFQRIVMSAMTAVVTVCA